MCFCPYMIKHDKGTSRTRVELKRLKSKLQCELILKNGAGGGSCGGLGRNRGKNEQETKSTSPS